MPSSFSGKFGKSVYDRMLILKMALTMTRREIIQQTGISRGHLSQILSATRQGPPVFKARARSR